VTGKKTTKSLTSNVQTSEKNCAAVPPKGHNLNIFCKSVVLEERTGKEPFKSEYSAKTLIMVYGGRAPNSRCRDLNMPFLLLVAVMIRVLSSEQKMRNHSSISDTDDNDSAA
jgi:hypothetical protein